ncbi:CPBP family intramembrane glutamic endopeptidase [Undibacterium terreum]|uniref:CPBP family intramembrane glutamic endopeptidase n=1 Tax=Undibacterium terreum TaxID=1224302 RepID=UPI001667D5F5|nr:CPBP family intramembrane glutamic endopeptidase [Undibacterium terreum]
MLTTFLLLGLAIGAAWLKPIPITARFSLHPWLLVFSLSVISGLFASILNIAAVAALVIFTVSAYLVVRPQAPRTQRVLFGAITTMIALALAMHKLPGFNNPVLLPDSRFSANAELFRQYANFDKGAVGLVLLAFLCKRSMSFAELGEAFRRALPVAGMTIVLVMATAIPIGCLQPDFKLPAFTPIFLLTNLFLTCIAEEAFFRGFLQDRLGRTLKKLRWGGVVAIVVSAVLFGLAHAGGGMKFVLLATLSGIGYAYAYQITKKIEAAILAHFLLNAVHFLFFTYPYLQQA